VASPVIKRCFCNGCVRDTDHEVAGETSSTQEHPDGSASKTVTRLLRCRGCNQCCISKSEYYYTSHPDPDGDDDPHVRTEYIPPRIWRGPPDWVASLETTDPDLHGLLGEIYSAMNGTQTRLLSMGVRAAVDHVMTRILGSDLGSFEQKLSAMVERDHLTGKQKQNLEIVIDAGSASSHRGYRPAQQLLEEMVTVLEGMVREHYITGPMLETAKLNIPPRPPRQRGKPK
jgi:hypothetical protein